MARQMSGEMSVPHSEATTSTKYTDQPSSYQWNLEGIIPKVARAMSDDDQIERLGRALGFEYPDIKKFITMNQMEREVTSGTKVMLRKWAEKVSVTREQQALRDALRKAELIQVEEKCLPNQEGEMSLPHSEATTSTKYTDQLSSYQWNLEDFIPEVAKAIPDDDQIERLGRALGFEHPDIKRFITLNQMEGEVTTRGTKEMLHKWAEKVSVTEEQQALRDALRKAELIQIEEECFPNQGHPSMSPEMKKFQKELKDTYCREYSMIKTSPLDPESEKRLEEIYVKLELILGDEKKGEKKSLEYYELLDLIRTETESGLKTRFAFIGEAGVGKSTLLARIAFDWATGKCLQEIALLFLLPLREVMMTEYFGDIALNYVSDDIELEGKEIDGFIRNHQRQVLFLFDGLDESRISLKSPYREDAGVSILRGDRFRESAVIVTTRPSQVEQIKTTEKIRKQYTFVQVDGFTKENMEEYVCRFFEDDTDSSSSLIEFMQTNQIIAEYMAPYPIFCSMLCHQWKSKSKREKVQEIGTFSQIMKEMVFSLQEHYCFEYSGYECEDSMKRTEEAMANIGLIAFHGLLINQLVFKKDEIMSVFADAMIACDMGILSKERKLLPKEIRHIERKQFVDEFCFHHKLMQEFMAAHYLASLYYTDLSEFQEVLRGKLLGNKRDFRYVLYFTAAHGGEVGRSVMEALCHVHQNDLDFIMEVVFECQDMEAIDHVVNLVRREWSLNLTVDYPGMSHHAVSGYLLTLERCGQIAMRTSSIPENLDSPSNATATSSSSYRVAVGLSTLENLRRLHLGAGLDDDFYTGMAIYAPKSQVETLNISHVDLSQCSSASKNLAGFIYKMPHLKNLILDCRCHDEFYSVLSSLTSSSEGCFPQISKGNFRFNGSPVESLESFLMMLSDYQGLEVSHSGSVVIQSEKGAVPTNEEEITVHWQFIADTPPDLIVRDDEVVISDGIRFFPSGATFSTPVKITLEHNAYFTNPKQAEIVFYTRSKGPGSFERISASSTGCPRCDIRKTDLDLYVDHFCQWWIVAVMSRYFVGMKVNCKPYVELPLRRQSYYLRLSIYDDLPQVCMMMEKEMTNYKELHPAEPFFVKWRSGNVVIKLLEQQDDHEREVEKLEISENSLYRVNRRRLAFLMTPPVDMESQKLIRFTFAQDNSQTDPTVIALNLHYVGGILQLRNRSQAAAAAAAAEAGPLQEEMKLIKLSQKLPVRKYFELCNKLGIGFNEADGILKQFANDYARATVHCLVQWKTNERDCLSKLKTILREVEVSDLVKYIEGP